MKFKIAALQLGPTIGQFSANCARATLLISKLFTDSKPDLVVLPELSLVGYNFTSKQHIGPYLENFHAGESNGFAGCPSLNWAVATAEKYRCFLLVGYPEIHRDVIYNSSCLISPYGTVIHNYRKSFLYETDYTFGAEENPLGFESFKLNLHKQYYGDLKLGVDARALSAKYKSLFVKCCIGICMDLSNYKFKAPFEKFEFATYCFENDVDLILFPMAWLLAGSTGIESGDSQEAQIISRQFSKVQPVIYNYGESDQTYGEAKMDSVASFDRDLVDTNNLNYWILRCVPLYNNIFKMIKAQPPNRKVRYMVLNNRIGLETDVLYGGTSSIIRFGTEQPSSPQDAAKFQMDKNNPGVKVLGSLPAGREGALVREIDIATAIDEGD